MRFVEPNQGLASAVGTILSGVNLDDFVRFVLRRLLQGLLNVVAWKNMIPILGHRDGPVNRQHSQSNPHQDRTAKSFHRSRIIQFPSGINLPF